MWTGEVNAWVTMAFSNGFAKMARTTSRSPSRSILVTRMAKLPVALPALKHSDEPDTVR